MFQQVNSLVIDPRVDARIRLKQVVRELPEFSSIAHSTSLQAAQDTLSGSESFDLIFISSSLGKQTIDAFIANAKALRSSRDAAFILLLSTGSQDSSSLAQTMLGNTDCILLEPYSVDSLKQVTEISSKLRQKRRAERLSTALGYFVQELLSQVDHLALLKKSGYPANVSIKVFREMCSVLRTLEPEEQSCYLKLLEEASIKAKLTEQSTQSYSGASQRVRKKFVERALDRLRSMRAA